MGWPTLVLSPNIIHMIHTKIIAMHFLGRVMLHLAAWWNIKFSFQYCYYIIIILDGNKTGDDDAMWSNNVRINDYINMYVIMNYKNFLLNVKTSVKFYGGTEWMTLSKTGRCLQRDKK